MAPRAVKVSLLLVLLVSTFAIFVTTEGGSGPISMDLLLKIDDQNGIFNK